jgi:hypothetical protein
MSRRTLLAPLLLTLVATAPLRAAIPDPRAAIEAPGNEQQLGTAATLVDANKPGEALAILDPLLAATDLPIERGQIEALRSFALARLQRIPEAHKAIETGVASNPSPSLLLLRQLFLLRAFDGDPAGASDTLQLIAASMPDGLAQLPSEVVGDVMRSIKDDETRAFNTDYALVAAGWSPPDATLADADWLRLRLMTGLAKRGRLDDVPAVLARVLSPVILVRMGIDRRFESLWPVIEKRLGPGADIADAAYVAAAKARFDKTPQSLIARLGYAEALNIASREPEAMAIADVATTPAELASLNDQEIWLVNLHAALLGDAGRIDAALARYEALNAGPIAGRGNLIGTMINEALFAESANRPESALAAADRAARYADGISEAGRFYLAQARACALQQQGKSAEAATTAAPIIAKPEVNDNAFLATMICLGRMGEAADAITRRLGDADTRGEMLFQLQPFLIADATKLREVKLRAAMRALKARPEVKTAYLKAGRDMPQAVAPPR